uniref:Uncharacterized protein n=1 Tax=Theileria parva TaxID=5875 RepID=Q4N4W7_THEPA|eukprot:XP_765089.1 hypothetical protein [Theileria parva strain Muguga]
MCVMFSHSSFLSLLTYNSGLLFTNSTLCCGFFFTLHTFIRGLGYQHR